MQDGSSGRGGRGGRGGRREGEKNWEERERDEEERRMRLHTLYEFSLHLNHSLFMTSIPTYPTPPPPPSPAAHGCSYVLSHARGVAHTCLSPLSGSPSLHPQPGTCRGRGTHCIGIVLCIHSVWGLIYNTNTCELLHNFEILNLCWKILW